MLNDARDGHGGDGRDGDFHNVHPDVSPLQE